MKTLLHILKVQFLHPRPKPRYKFVGRQGPLLRWEAVNDKRAPGYFCIADDWWADSKRGPR